MTEINYKAGEQIQCTITSLPRAQAQTTTIARLMRRDPTAVRALRRAQRLRKQRMHTYIRGGRKWFDAVAIGPGFSGDVDAAVQAARRFVYAQGDRNDEIIKAADTAHDEIIVDRVGGLIRIDLLAEGYRVFPDGHRLAR